VGVLALHEASDVNYYSLIDLQEIGGTLYGPEFKSWFINSDLRISFLFRLADETGVVLLTGKGFEVVDTSARISLANLTEIEYALIGKFTRQVLDECYQNFQKANALQ
jgi:aspartate 4-decarboxylase